MHRVLAATIVVALGLSVSVLAQTGTEGSILGTVTDASGALIPGATVVITNIETGITKRVDADSTGYFQVLALVRGLYSVTVSRAGFATWQLQSIGLTSGEN